MADTAEQLVLYFPLFGVSFAGDAFGEITRGVAVYVPAVEQWRTLRKTEVWNAHPLGEPESAADTVKPPCCIVANTSLPEGPHHPNAIAACGKLLLTAGRDAVVALRLLHAGWFLHPEESMHLYYAPTLPLNVLRAPGPYRQVFVTGAYESSSPPYELTADDVTRVADMPSAIDATWALLQAYRRTGGDMSVELAIEGFNRSYGYQLSFRGRAGILFTALEAMLGGMSTWWIGRVPVKPRGYARRVEIALRTSAAPQPIADPRATSSWLASADGGRGLRNAIAHGEADGGDELVRDAYEQLQAIVRSVLYQYLHFATLWLGPERPNIAGRLALDEDSPLAAAYVAALEGEAHKPGSMLELLQ